MPSFTSNDLEVPEEMTILLLPLYSPELNPVERVWAYLKSPHMSNRAFAGYDDLLGSATEAWRQLTPKLLKSICACDYV